MLVTICYHVLYLILTPGLIIICYILMLVEDYKEGIRTRKRMGKLAVEIN